MRWLWPFRNLGGVSALGWRPTGDLSWTAHLSDPVAYRRDRRKDQLLQQNGYFVLRFLDKDVGEDLDTVLDAILPSAPVAIGRPS